MHQFINSFSYRRACVRLIFIMPLLLLSACSGMSLSEGWEKPQELTKEELWQTEDHMISPEDELEVIVWGVPEFEASNMAAAQSGVRQAGYSYLVHADGSIDLPLVGNMAVGGLTVDAAKQVISTAMLQFVDEPKVGVTVTKYNSRKILVLGEVGKPGLVLNPGPSLSLAEAIAQAGGMNGITASGSHVYIIRGALAVPKVARVSLDTAVSMFQAQHIWLKSRDVVFVDSRAITDWNRFISQLLPTVGSAFMANGIAN
jgi:protein involved in polysaccharide export with SLBB domain